MFRRAALLAVLTLPLLLPVPTAHAGDTTEGKSTRPAQIQWFGTWDAAKAEAKRTGRAILLTAAACNCGGIPGMW